MEQTRDVCRTLVWHEVRLAAFGFLRCLSPPATKACLLNDLLVAEDRWRLAACERGFCNVCCVCLDVFNVIPDYLDGNAHVSANCTLTYEVSQLHVGIYFSLTQANRSFNL
jgi:hypothetical protein